MSTEAKNEELSPTKQLKKDVAESLRGAASKFNDELTQSQHRLPRLFDGWKNDGERPDESDVCYDESEDYQVIESGFVVDDLPNPVTSEVIIEGTDPEQITAKKVEAPCRFSVL